MTRLVAFFAFALLTRPALASDREVVRRTFGPGALRFLVDAREVPK
jgi:hypothetical protein